MNLATLDLNSLVLLEALLEERSVTRAGARVGLSQPAASNGLKRLRLFFGDRLLEKDGRGLRLSERGHQLRVTLGRALDELRAAIDSPAPFEAGSARFKVDLFASDHIVFVLMPTLHRRLSKLAPAADIVIHWTQNARVLDLLESGAVDLAIGRHHNTPADIRRAKLYDETLVVQARRGHPIFQGDLTPRRFAEFPRVATSFDGRVFGDQEQAMARAGLDVKSQIVLPHLIAAPLLTLEGDLVTIAPRRMASRLSSLLELDWCALPFPSATIPIEMLWHERTAGDASLSWFRQLLIDISGEI